MVENLPKNKSLKKDVKVFTYKTRKQKFLQVFNVFNIDDLTFDDHMQLYLWLMRCLGFDYEQERSVTIHGFATFFVASFNAISGIEYVKNNLHDMMVVTECLTTTFLAFMLTLKVILFFIYKDIMLGLIYDAKAAFNAAQAKGGDEWRIMKKLVKEARIVTRIFYYATIAVTVLFVLCALLNYKERRLPLGLKYIGFYSDTILNYVLNFSIHIVAMCCTIHFMTGYQSVVIYFLLITCANIDIVTFKLSTIGNHKEFFNCDETQFEAISDGVVLLDTPYTKRYFKKCIIRHQEIFRCIEVFNKVFELDCFGEVVLSSLIGCVSLFQIVETPEMFPFYLYLISCILQVFIYCWYGDLIFSKGVRLTKVLTQTPWYKCDQSIKSMIGLMIMRSQKPIYISAIFSNLTLECFTSVMRATYSYYTVLSQSME